MIAERHPWPADATRDRLIGDWYIHQRRGGHRTSTDDVLTAWFAVARTPSAMGRPRAYLDLGCGIGSVLLMTTHRLRPTRVVGVEAQGQSVAMARRSVAELPERGETIEIVHMDMRELALDDRLGPLRFELITGSPPYFPIGTGVVPEDPQRRACRFEERGGVEVYCAAAARASSDEGRFVLVFQTTWDARVQAAARNAGLHVTARADVTMREGRAAPFLTVYELRRSPAPLERVAFSIRDAAGAITTEYQAARRMLGVAD